jgi:phenylacetate-CoA ligase
MRDLTPPPESLDPIETASRDEIAALQLARLKETLAQAYARVPFYRQSFDAAGVHPDHIRTLSDLSKLPVHHKAGPARPTTRSACLPCRANRIARIHASSGTTGKPTVVGYTRS